ncbi:MAG TPA: hypothetical protein VGC04_12055 [Cellulomonas sp.]
MNGTNRALNRAVLIVVGCVALAAGLAGVGSAALPAGAAVRDGVATTASRFFDWLPTWQAHLEGLGWGAVPWVLLLVPVAALVLIVLLCLVVAAQGRGRTRDVLRERSAGDDVPGLLAVDVNIASAVIGDTLDGRPDCVGATVSAYRLRGATGGAAMKVTITPRRGADVGRLVDEAARAVGEWDELLGRRLPVLVHLTRGSWSGLRRPSRVT